MIKITVRRAAPALAVLAAVAIATQFFLELPGQQTAAASPQRKGDIVMVRCDSAGASFNVTGFLGSTAAPSKKSKSCPETLALLMKDGFSVEDIGHYDLKTSFVLYTLVR
jgi:hypothetical protein